ncbi:alkaline phosphatase family protein [Halobacterium wangiae]|uniref:alkaline phosphatase family protein n=1 Tax=Halobacterium wangiae TaxID=2902623 RepID=UPI001E4F00D9|nr:alkaline phosphatase family protein [Halobacterium wangiae]
MVLGLDGVPWDLVERWTDEGHLPNFQRLFEEGASGVLESTKPAHTALAWPSISTGVWPDDHGVYGFQNLASDYTHEMNASENVQRPALWDHLDPAVVANVPMTYPAADIDGEMVAGMMTPRLDDGFTSPSSLGDEIEAEIPDYEIGLDWGEYGDSEAAFVEDLEALVENRTALLEKLMAREDWRHFFFVFTAPDRLQHLIWDEDVLLEWYQVFDDIVGDVMEYAEQRGAVLNVVSDHGFGPNETIVSAAALLEREGYLERREASGMRGTLAELGIDKQNVLSKLDRVGVTKQRIVDYVPQAFVNVAALQVPGEHSLFDVDHENTVAFTHGEGSLYVNDTERFDDGIVDPADVPDLKAELQELFEDLTDPETGEEVFSVFDGDDIFPRDDDSPDLVIRGEGEYEVMTMLTEDVFVDATTKAAGHHEDGIYFAWGPTVEAGAEAEDATVVDVAPTLLHAVGEPVPDYVDGRVLSEIFEAESTPATRAVETTEVTAERETASVGEGDGGDMDDVEDRLRGLGYIE